MRSLRAKKQQGCRSPDPNLLSTHVTVIFGEHSSPSL